MENNCQGTQSQKEVKGKTEASTEEPPLQASLQMTKKWSYFIIDADGRQRVKSHHRVCKLAEVTSDSGSTFDSWPSAEEEECILENGERERFRLREVVKDDLSFLTGSGPVEPEDYFADIDEKDERKTPRKKQSNKLANDGYDADTEERKN